MKFLLPVFCKSVLLIGIISSTLFIQMTSGQDVEAISESSLDSHATAARSQDLFSQNYRPPIFPAIKCLARRGQFPHLNFCNWFYNCWDGAVYEQQCPAGLVFNAARRYCDYPYNVDCGTRSISDGKVIDGSTCSTRNGILYAVKSDCSSFITCVNGQAVRRRCPLGTFFNPSILACDHQSNNIQCYTSQPIPYPGNFRCPRPEGVFPHLDPSHYWICHRNNLVLMTCPPGFIYDSLLGHCNLAVHQFSRESALDDNFLSESTTLQTPLNHSQA